ncbi:MAG: ABC transporter permease, partial [Oscillospiraceae bacterium]|nr:ABC transporter permease [Oscillospiraceae bacterium]
GMTTYIDTLQEDTLSSYPLTIEATHLDLGTLMTAFLETASSGVEHEMDAVYSKPLVYDMINALNNMETTTNDLETFKAWLEAQLADETSALSQAVSGIQYTYDLNLCIYTKNVDDAIIQSDSLALLQEMAYAYLGMDLSTMMELGEESGMMSMMSGSMGYTNVWQEMLPGENGRLISDLLDKQYDVVYGSWPTEYNEIVLVLDENNELDDMTLYALGLKSETEMEAIMDAAVNKTELPVDVKSWSYEEICDMDFRIVLPSDCYTLDESTGLYLDLRETDAGLRYLYDNGIALKVSGIIRPSEDAVSTMLSGSIGYTSELTEYIITQARDSAVVKAQMEQPDTDIFTGLPFHSTTGSLTDAEKEVEFRSFVEALDAAGLASTYVKIMSIPSQEELDAMVAQAMDPMTVEDMRATLTQALVEEMGMNETDVASYITAMTDEEVTEIFTDMITEQVLQQYAAQVAQQLSALSEAELAGAMTMALPTYTTEQCAAYYDAVLTFSDSSYEDNLVELGCLDLDDPAGISLYAATFESKDVIEDAIRSYNESAEDELKQIKYTDYVGLMMSSVTTIINAITYVLIAFVAISLIVSSIMIGVITLISVQERTKEIGILRAIGASKKNVSSMFNAETVMIGFASGALGVGLTYLLCIPINAIIQHLTGIDNLRAYLPWQVAGILIAISILLSVFAGFIPSRSAAKKDPVVALRTE